MTVLLKPDLAVVDCMLPGAIAAARAAGAPVVSLVHFLNGPARDHMRRTGSGGTTDLRALAATHRTLGLPPAPDALAAWEAADQLLVTAPAWLDVDCDARSTSCTPGRSGSALHRRRAPPRSGPACS